MARKKSVSKSKIEFDKKFPPTYDGLSYDDEVVYKRVSDGVMSIGRIRYFHMGDPVCATVIDLLLGNFQTAIVEEIDRDPTQKLVQKLWSKAAGSRKKAPRQLRRQAKTKKT